MKLFTAQQIKEWDAYTIRNEPVSSADLMERAANACVKALSGLVPSLSQKVIHVFCGKGNNGGDGLAIARILAARGIRVKSYIVQHAASASPDHRHNEERLRAQGKCMIYNISSEADFPAPAEDDVLIDAIFGTGLNRPAEGIAGQLIRYLNESSCYTVAIDIPSGLPAELFDDSLLKSGLIIKADHTLTFQVPKKSFLIPSAGPFAGEFTVLDIGLDKRYAAMTDSKQYYLREEDIAPLIRVKEKFAHKGAFGHLLAIGGSYGKIGASVLMSTAAIRTGCGLLTAFIPKVGYTILQAAVPEAMVMTDDEIYEIRNFPDTSAFSAVCVGPGLGQHAYTIKSFERWIKTVTGPCVIDADALNICARLLQEHHFTFRFPENAILTPHPKEFDRLAGVSGNPVERMEKQQHFAAQHQVFVVLKGAHTSIATPQGELYFNSTGNPAMATGGSGDVLTGIIGALLAGKYSPLNAALAGVYIHGMAGDRAAEGKYSITASDIAAEVPSVMKMLSGRS